MTQLRASESQPDDATPNRDAGPRRRKPGRPPTHVESWTKVTVVLFDRQIEYLDRLVATMRTKHGTPISRAQIIRALVDAASQSDLDLSASASEAELRAAIAARFGSGSK